jgi:hypothetical protein
MVILRGSDDHQWGKNRACSISAKQAKNSAI